MNEQPDQIDMMPEKELRFEVRRLVKELTELRAKSKAYDEGRETWSVVTCDGLSVSIGTRRQCILLSKSYNENPAYMNGYTCEKVRICKEVGG